MEPHNNKSSAQHNIGMTSYKQGYTSGGSGAQLSSIPHFLGQSVGAQSGSSGSGLGVVGSGSMAHN